MLLSVAEDLAKAGHEVLLSADARLFSQVEQNDLAAKYQVFTNVSAKDGLPASWWEIANCADQVLIIAPEFSGLLSSAIAKLRVSSKGLLNCCDEFLEVSCDKWLAAQKWQAAGVAHPATRLLCDVDANWVAANSVAGARWVIKPRDGAGCEGIQVVERDALLAAATGLGGRQLQSDIAGYIAQPFHSGAAFSQAAIVDATGRAHWLPLVTQELRITNTIHYCGGEVLAVDGDTDCLGTALNALGAGALGWVGFDLLQSSESGEWMVIEVNPRLTTSFVGLSRAFGGGLTAKLISACSSGPAEIDRDWKAVKFDARGVVAE